MSSSADTHIIICTKEAVIANGRFHVGNIREFQKGDHITYDGKVYQVRKKDYKFVEGAKNYVAIRLHVTSPDNTLKKGKSNEANQSQKYQSPGRYHHS